MGRTSASYTCLNRTNQKHCLRIIDLDTGSLCSSCSSLTNKQDTQYTFHIASVSTIALKHQSRNMMNLNFVGHVSELCTRASQKVGILVRLQNLIPCNAKLMLYKTSILPYLTYCNLVWKFYRLLNSEQKTSAPKSMRCAQYTNLKLKRTRNSSIALSFLRFITGVCKTLQY